MTEPFRVGYVEGVTPDKWIRIWRERRRDPLDTVLVTDARQSLEDGTIDMVLARLPLDRDGLHVIPLYDERPVVVVPVDHAATAFDEIALAELDDLRLTVSAELTTREAVETVAAGTGILVVPQSIARLHRRKDVRAVFLTDQEHTQVALAWRDDVEDERVEEFIGIVRGRTARSSRGGTTSPSEARPPRDAKRRGRR